MRGFSVLWAARNYLRMMSRSYVKRCNWHSGCLLVVVTVMAGSYSWWMGTDSVLHHICRQNMDYSILTRISEQTFVLSTCSLWLQWRYLDQRFHLLSGIWSWDASSRLREKCVCNYSKELVTPVINHPGCGLILCVVSTLAVPRILLMNHCCRWTKQPTC